MAIKHSNDQARWVNKAKCKCSFNSLSQIGKAIIWAFQKTERDRRLERSREREQLLRSSPQAMWRPLALKFSGLFSLVWWGYLTFCHDAEHFVKVESAGATLVLTIGSSRNIFIWLAIIIVIDWESDRVREERRGLPARWVNVALSHFYNCDASTTK